MTVPAEIRAGLSWSWEVTLDEYPSETWALVYYFTNAAAAFNIAASGFGTRYTLTQNSTQTAARAAGRYEWAARVSSGTAAHLVGQGFVEILPALGVARDIRGPWRRALDSLEAQIAEGVSWDTASISVGGRQKTFRSAQDLLDTLAFLKVQVQLEEQGERFGLGRDIRVRFGRA